jgi:hypothetical protein
MTRGAFVTDITAESDGLTKTVTASHILLIMVRLESGGPVQR